MAEAGQVSHRSRQVKWGERGGWQSSWSIVPQSCESSPQVEKVGNQGPWDPLEGRRHRAEQRWEGKTGETLSSPTVATTRQRRAAQARHAPARPFVTRAPLIDGELLQEAYHRTRRDGAPGIDGVTAEE